MRRYTSAPVRPPGLHCRPLRPQGHRPEGFRAGFEAMVVYEGTMEISTLMG